MSTITYTVKVASAKFTIDDAVAPKLTFRDGDTYVFDQADSSNAGHILQFSITSNNSGSSEYTTGVTKTGTAGQAGAKTTIITSGSTTDTLYYYSSGGGTYGEEFSNSGFNTSTTYNFLKPIIGGSNTAEKWGSMVNHTIDQIDQKYNEIDVIQTNIALLGFKVAVNGSLAKYDLQDQIVDEYETEAGVNTGDSTNQVYDSGVSYSGNVYGTVTGGMSGEAGVTVGDYKVHTFRLTENSTNFVNSASGVVDIMVIAGGGGGGWDVGGGGGAGGMAVWRNYTLAAGTYAVTVGDGGDGSASTATAGDNGDPSRFGTTLTQIAGGGGGGGHPSSNGSAGGSGGGSQGWNTTGTGGTGAGTIGTFSGSDNSDWAYGGGLSIDSGAGLYFGGDGGDNTIGTTNVQAAGGGGAGGDGGVAIDQGNNSTVTDNRGTGLDNWFRTGAVVRYAKGGGGGNDETVGTGGAGDAHTGEGGAGAGPAPGNGTKGGSGLVVIRYASDAFTSYNDITLQSSDTTAETAPTKADMVILVEDAGSGVGTVNTHIKGWVSRYETGGTKTWTQGTLVDEGHWGVGASVAGKRILAFHNLTLTGTSGTQMAYKITTHSASAVYNTKIHATSIGWR